MENIIKCFELLGTIIFIIGSFNWAIISGIVVGLWNNPMLILFIVGWTAPVFILKRMFKIR